MSIFFFHLVVVLFPESNDLAHSERFDMFRCNRPLAPSDTLENFFFGHALVRGNSGEDRIQCPDAQWRMCRNCDAMVRRVFGLQNDVTADLMDSLVLSALRQMPRQRFTA